MQCSIRLDRGPNPTFDPPVQKFGLLGKAPDSLRWRAADVSPMVLLLLGFEWAIEK
jgi:hypothetical protein